MKTYTRYLDDGVSTMTGPGVEFECVSEQPVSMELQATGPTIDHRRSTREVTKYHHPTYFVIVDGRLTTEPRPPRGPAPMLRLKKGQRIILPAELEQAVQRTECVEPMCSSRSVCRNQAHQRGRVIGGLAWMLARVPESAEEPIEPPKLHPALMTKAPPPSTHADVDSRLLQRVRGAQ